MDITKLDAISIISDDVLMEVFEEQDAIEQAKLLLALQEKAKILGVKGKFDTLVKAYKKILMPFATLLFNHKAFIIIPKIPSPHSNSKIIYPSLISIKEKTRSASKNNSSHI